jgi:hypothetical protein
LTDAQVLVDETGYRSRHPELILLQLRLAFVRGDEYPDKVRMQEFWSQLIQARPEQQKKSPQADWLELGTDLSRFLDDVEAKSVSVSGSVDIKPERFSGLDPMYARFSRELLKKRQNIDKQELLVLAFHLVATGAAELELLYDWGGDRFRKALATAGIDIPLAGLEEILAQLPGVRPLQQPNPFWLAWSWHEHNQRLQELIEEFGNAR